MPYTKDKSNTKVIKQTEIDARRKEKKTRRNRFYIYLAAALSVTLIIVFFISGGYEKVLDLLGIERDVSVEPKVTKLDTDVREKALIFGINNTLIIYDEHGVTGYAKDGKWKWNFQCDLTEPAVSSCNSFVILYDIGGKAVYAFNADGLVWRFGSEQKIKSVFAGGENCICVMHEEPEYLCAVSVYNYDAKTMGLKEQFKRKFGSHYMLAGAVSQDGKQIAVSGVLSSGSKPKGIVSFLRVSDGEIFSGEDTDGDVYIKSVYSKNGSVFMANSDSLRLLKSSMSVSSDNDVNNKLWDRKNQQEKITGAVLLNGNTCAIAVGSEDYSKSTVKSFGENGKQGFNLEITGIIKGIDSYGDGLLVYTEKNIYFYNGNGALIGTQEAGFAIENAVCIGKRNAAVHGEGQVLLVSFE